MLFGALREHDPGEQDDEEWLFLGDCVCCDQQCCTSRGSLARAFSVALKPASRSVSWITRAGESTRPVRPGRTSISAARHLTSTRTIGWSRT
jgi:hypothetical protein